MKELKGVKYLHLNIRGLLPKFELLEEDFLDGSIDVMCLTETWLKRGIPDSLICNPRVNLIRHDRTTINSVTGNCKTGGGIVVYLKKGINYEVFDSDSVCTNDVELSVKISVNGNKKQMLITVYRLPSGNVSKAIGILSGCFEKFNDKFNSTEFVMMGDMNINYLEKKCKQVKLLKAFEKQFGLSQLIQSATRVTAQKGTLIDL